MGTSNNYGSIDEQTTLTIPEPPPPVLPVHPAQPLASKKQLWLYTGVMLVLFCVSVTLGIGIPLAVTGTSPDTNINPLESLAGKTVVINEEDAAINSKEESEPKVLWHRDEDEEDYEKKVDRILDRVPLIDGHNDFAWNVRNFLNNQIEDLDFSTDLREVEPWKSHLGVCHTDLPRLRKGRVGGQFWSAFVECRTQYKDAVVETLEQIDVIKRLIQKYPDDLEFVTTAKGVEAAHSAGRIGSLIGVEGGHSIASSLGTLRLYYELGVRYLTLTHNCDTPWAHSNLIDMGINVNISEDGRGLSEFGKTLVLEMNRLGMVVDLSHVSYAVMADVLDTVRAPVMFSHSSAFAVCPHARNVRDDILMRMQDNGGVVMVNFLNPFVSCADNATLEQVIDHINHIRAVAGIDHIGLGADFDGGSTFPDGLKDVSSYPHLLVELMKSGTWTKEDIEKIAGKNILRVLKAVEEVKAELEDGRSDVKVNEQWLPVGNVPVSALTCVTQDASFNRTETEAKVEEITEDASTLIEDPVFSNEASSVVAEETNPEVEEDVNNDSKDNDNPIQQ